MASSDQLETKLDEVFTKNAPKLPDSAKQAIVEYAPWGALGLGVVSLWAAWNLWHWAQFTSSVIDYTNRLDALYGGPATVENRLTFWVWLGLIVVAAEGVLYLLAYQGLRAHTKAGWNYLYWGALLNIVYALLNLFIGNDGFSNFLGCLVGSAVGLWLLFQIREQYLPAAAKTTHRKTRTAAADSAKLGK